MPIYENHILDRLSAVAEQTGAQRRAAGEVPATLLRRAKLLPDDEKLLLELSVQRRLSSRQIGQILGVDNGTVSRRVRRIKRKLTDPVAVALCDPTCGLDPALRDLAVAHFLRGASARQLAADAGTTPEAVRRRIEYVRGWVRGRREGWAQRARMEAG